MPQFDVNRANNIPEKHCISIEMNKSAQFIYPCMKIHSIRKLNKIDWACHNLTFYVTVHES